MSRPLAPRSPPAALAAAIAVIEPLDEGAMAQARARQDQLTKPHGSLGRLEELAVWAASLAAAGVRVLVSAVSA